jgi:hypothetical protein
MPIAENAGRGLPSPAIGCTRLNPPLARAARAMARRRLESELRSIVLDLVGFCESDVSAATIRAWVDDATAPAVRAACDRSMAELIDGLEGCLEQVPSELVDCLNASGARRDVGSD